MLNKNNAYFCIPNASIVAATTLSTQRRDWQSGGDSAQESGDKDRQLAISELHILASGVLTLCVNKLSILYRDN